MIHYRANNFYMAKEKGKISLSVAIVLGLVILNAIYLFQANSIVARNFELRAVRQDLSQTQENNQKISVALMQASSLNNLEGAAKDLNLVSVDKINYLKTIFGIFALSQQP